MLEYNYCLALNDTHCHYPAVSNKVGMAINESSIILTTVPQL